MGSAGSFIDLKKLPYLYEARIPCDMLGRRTLLVSGGVCFELAQPASGNRSGCLLYCKSRHKNEKDKFNGKFCDIWQLLGRLVGSLAEPRSLWMR